MVRDVRNAGERQEKQRCFLVCVSMNVCVCVCLCVYLLHMLIRIIQTCLPMLEFCFWQRRTHLGYSDKIIET